MFILQMVGWLIFSCILASFVEHQVHRTVWGASTDDAVTLAEAMLFTSQLRRAAVSGHDWCAELTDIHAHFSDSRYDHAVVVSKCPGPPEPLRSG